MKFELKPIHKDAIPEALDKAHLYRLLNEPVQAQSICLDVLRLEPEHPKALITLLLALTDQFGAGVSPAKAHEVLARMKGDYERAYYAGLIAERSAHARLRQSSPGAGFDAYDLFLEAMKHYEVAEQIRPAANDDAILRWNTCARMLMRTGDLRPRPDEEVSPVFGE
ncbi:MAG: hypothetical protein K2X35_12825 [Bryobacteraceae bacterium]|nr:hypothetical protein [Bryobacteraceae bacterium]